MDYKPIITINGQQLTNGQAAMLRVAVTGFDCECGDDAHGMRMREQYTARKNEVVAMLSRPPSTTELYLVGPLGSAELSR